MTVNEVPNYKHGFHATTHNYGARARRDGWFVIN